MAARASSPAAHPRLVRAQEDEEEGDLDAAVDRARRVLQRTHLTGGRRRRHSLVAAAPPAGLTLVVLRSCQTLIETLFQQNNPAPIFPTP